MKPLLIIVIFSSFSSFAGLQELLKYVYKSNLTLEAARLDVTASEIDLTSVDARYDWILEANLGHQDSFRDALLSFQSLRTISDTLTASLKKNFSWGGSFAIEQGVRNYNLTNWGSSSNGFIPADFEDRPFEYFSNFVFTQDLSKNFLGRNDKADIEVFEAEISLKKKQVEDVEQQVVVQLTTLYARASYLKSLIKST